MSIPFGSSLTLPAIADVVPGKFEFELPDTQLRDLANWLITAGALKPQQWRGHVPSAVRSAIKHALGDCRPNPLVRMDINCTTKWDDCDGSELAYKYPAAPKGKDPGALIVGIAAASPLISTIGPVLDYIESSRPGYGRTVYRVLNQGLEDSCRGLTPWSGHGWCQSIYWRGEHNEEWLIEEELSEMLSDEDNKDFHALTKEQQRAYIADNLNIFTEKDYLADFPKWTTPAMPKGPAPERLHKLNLRRCHWPAIREATIALDEQVKRLARRKKSNVGDYKRINDISLTHTCAWEACPFLLRWSGKDCLPRLWDDVMNNHFEGGEANLDLNAAFVFWDAASLGDALDRLRYYLSLTQACENLLRALGVKNK